MTILLSRYDTDAADGAVRRSRMEAAVAELRHRTELVAALLS
jgi:hypothetical protein